MTTGCDGDWRFPTPQELKQELLQEFTREEKEEVWSNTAQVMSKYYDELIVRWKEEIDTLLVYAGLFSAALTAFNVQSYQLLQPSSTDATLATLREISAQLRSFSVTPRFVNATHSAQSLPGVDPVFTAPLFAVWLNTLWFSGLVCSLGSASIALIVKQWLREASSGITGTSRDGGRLRQLRLNALLKWRVVAIISTLPILLQIALGLFLAGVIILLWQVHTVVAAVTSLLVASLFLFHIVVTVLPVVRWDCCYRSPQTSAFYNLLRFFWNPFRSTCYRLVYLLWRMHARSIGSAGFKSLPLSILLWIRSNIPEIPTWHGHDRLTIARDSGILDRGIITTAYSTTLATTYLDRMHVVFSELPRDQLGSLLQDIYAACEQHWGGPDSPGRLRWYKNVDRVELAALYGVRYMLTVDEHERDDQWRQRTKSILDKIIDTRAAHFRCGLEMFISTLAPLSHGNDDLAWGASDRIAGYWVHAKTPEKKPASYSAIRSVLAVSQWRLQNWREEGYTFDNLLKWLRATRCVLLCVTRAAVNRNISVPELEVICTTARSILLDFETLLLAQNTMWARIEPESIGMMQGRQDRQWPGALPHRLSHLLVELVIKPVTAVHENEQIRHAIPRSLALTMQQTWAAVTREFPSPLDLQTDHGIQLYARSGLESIHRELADLLPLLDDVPER
ncbi:hypothetical protein C8Q76DRAFT_418791 [Earliella scabrosa]|nr:hypothetical protein C8Q76DRAFT_418791 [Earliella scabrosa]